MEEQFTPITTQEQLDAIIRDRVKRAQESARKGYEGWVSPEEAKKATEELEKRVKKLTEEAETARTTIAGHESTIKRYQAAELRSKIADEVGLDRRLVSRLSGDTEEALRKDAESLKTLFGGAGNGATGGGMASTEPQGAGSGWATVAAQLND